MPHTTTPVQRGFTLVEMAVVMAILGFLLGAGLMGLSSQIDQQQEGAARQQIEFAINALIGYAASHRASDQHPYLPCPDRSGGSGSGTANDGQEDRTASGNCVTQEGNLPWVTLGLGETDPWGHRLRYRVAAGFSNSQVGLSLTNTGDMTVSTSTSGGQSLATLVPAIVISHGKNGLGAITPSGQQIAFGTASANETANLNGDTSFVSRPNDDASASQGAFDDHLSWLSTAILFNRLIQAGVLP